MNHRFFISHYSGDKKIAEIITNTLKRISLNQIEPWFSSDESGTGGLKPGNLWFNEIIDKIEKSKSVVAILTPNSISRPWIYFETGIGQTLKDCEVMPICVGVNRDKVYPPLGLYQCYQLTDYRSFKEFIQKLLAKYSITFDEEAYKPIIEKSLSEILKIEFTTETEEPDPKLIEIIEDLKSHIDKRFVDIWERPNLNLTLNDSDKARVVVDMKEAKSTLNSYTIPIEINLKKFKTKKFLEIRDENTFGDITTNLYFIMGDFVEPYRYLQSWILREKKSNMHIVIREVGDLIPAKNIFKPEFEFEVIELDKPYDPKVSRDRVIEGFE